MNPRKLLAELIFVNEISAKRQTYYVYENKNYYILMTVSRAKISSCNLVFVGKGSPEYVYRTFKGKQKITTSEVVANSRKPEYIKSSFDALNALYILCATKKASIDHRYKGKALIFSIKK